MANAVLELIVKLKDEASSGIGSLGSSLGAMVNPASLALVAVGAVGGAFAAAVPAAANFESALNKFSAVSGVAGKDLKQFSDLALKMGAETQFSAQQAADAMVELAKGGIDPATIAAGGLEGALALAAAGQLELATAAGIVSKQLGVWADQGVTATDVANQFAQAANASTVDVDELALGMANVGGVAKVAGLSFKETTQAMALLAPGFSSAADAGTSFKAFLNNMVPTTKKAVEASKDLGLMAFDSAAAIKFLGEAGVKTAGLTEEQLIAAVYDTGKAMGLTDKEVNKLAASFDKSVFYDAAGNFVGMEKAAQLLHDATKDLTTEQRALAFETIFGSDAQRAAALIAEKGAAGYNAMGEAMSKAGTAAEQAAKMNQGLNFAMESLKGSIETILIVLGTMLLPVLTQFVNEGLIPAANGVLAFIQALSTGQVQVGGFGEEFSGVFTAVQGVVAVVMPFISSVVSSVLAAVAGFWQQNGADIMATASSVWSSVKSIITTAMQIITAVVGPALKQMAAWWTDNSATIQSVLTIAWAAIKLIITTALTLISGVLKAALQLIQGDWRGAWETIKLTATTIWENIKSIVSTAIKNVETTMGVTLDSIKAKVRDGLTTIANFFRDKFNEAVQAIRNAVGAAADAAGAIVNAILGRLNSAAGAIRSALVSPIEAAISAVRTAIDNLWSTFRSLQSAVSNFRIPSFSPPAGGGTVNTPVGTVPGRVGSNGFSAASGQAPITINIYSRGAGYADVVAAVNDALRQAGRRADARVLVGG